MSSLRPEERKAWCDRCQRWLMSTKILAKHQAAKSCRYRQVRTMLYSEGWAPLRGTSGPTIHAAGIDIIERYDTASIVLKWAPTWAVIIALSVPTAFYDGSPTQPGPKRRKLIRALRKTLEDADLQGAVETTARMRGAQGVAAMFDLSPRQRVTPHPGDWDPLWWLDPEESDR